MLTQLLSTLRNYFVVDRLHGEFALTSEGLHLTGDTVPRVGQYVLVQSVLNYAVCKVVSSDGGIFALTSDVELQPDTIQRVWLLAVPQTVVSLADRAKAYDEKQGDSELVSESYAGWSGTKAQGKHGALSWKEKFTDEMKPYMRLLNDL